MKARNLFSLGALLALFVSPSFAQNGPKEETLVLTLPQAVTMALEWNVDVALAELDVQTFRSQYKQAIGMAIGDLKATASYERNVKRPAAFFALPDSTGATTKQKFPVGSDNSFAAGLSFEQPLFSGGRISSGITGGKKRIEAGKEVLRGTREDVAFAVKELFYSYLLANATVSIQNDNQALTQAHLATIRERYRQGLDSDLIVLRQQVEVANADTQSIAARNVEDLAITNLQRVLFLDVDRPLKLVGKLEPPSVEMPDYENVTRQAMAKNAALSVAQKKVTVAEDFYRIVRADRLPDLKGFANLNWVGQSDGFSPGPAERNYDFGAGAKLEWRLFTGGEIRERVAQARIDIDRARKEEAKIEREIRVAVKQQWLNVRESRERARAQEASVGQATRAVQATEIRYKQGDASQLELNDATFALNRARTAYAQASHDYWVARAGLERVTGTSLEEVR
ncbi:MAG: TolC family protein [Pseudomonadota bacterium]